jgi:hypothetical protein
MPRPAAGDPEEHAMWESRWRTCTDSYRMLRFLWGRVSERKLRLFACACCRRVWDLLGEPRRRVIEVAERVIEGEATLEELGAARAAAFPVSPEAGCETATEAKTWAHLAVVSTAGMFFDQNSLLNLGQVVDMAAGARREAAAWEARRARRRAEGRDPSPRPRRSSALKAEQREQARLLRELFGPLPFRTVEATPAWRTWHGGTVPKLARAIYDEWAFDRLPVLADALEEAGCTDAEVLGHCREAGPHVRGCWVLDLLLDHGGALTEAEWLAWSDPNPMLAYLRGKVSDRKARLFAVACCRRMLGWVEAGADERHAVDVAESYADGQADGAELAAAEAAITSGLPQAESCAFAATSEDLVDCAVACALRAADAVGEAAADQRDRFLPDIEDRDRRSSIGRFAETALQADLLRDIAGNPFRPVRPAPAWRTAEVVTLARSIYDGRAFDRLPALADALEAAGCTDEDVLAHCREKGRHTRGCWVVDLVLAKP